MHGEGDAIGEPVRLSLFEWFVLNRMWEYHPTTGRLLYDVVVIGVGKGNAKTELAARIGDGDLLGPVAPISPRVVLAAASLEQADELFTAADLALMGIPEKPGHYATIFHRGNDLTATRIILPDGYGQLQRIAAGGGTSDGGKPTMFIGDELHEYLGEKQTRVWIVQSKSLRKRRALRRTPPELGLPPGVRLRGALQVGITTQGATADTMLGTLYAHGVNVARGHDEDGRPYADDPRFLFLWWEAWEGWDLDDPAQLTQAILEANPQASSHPDAWLPVENIAASILDRTIDRQEAVRYNLNRYPSPAEALIRREVWTGCDTTAKPDPALPAVAAVAVAHDHRSASIALAQRQDDRYVVTVAPFPSAPLPDGETVSVAELEGHLRTLHAAYTARVVSVIRPRATAPERKVALPGPLIVYAGAFFEGSAQRLRAERYALENIPQSRERLAAAMEALKGLVEHGRLSHDGDPILARAIGNIDGVESPHGWYPQARDPRIPITSAIAAAVAVNRAMTAPTIRAGSTSPVVAAGF